MPSPEPVTVYINGDGSAVELPVRPQRPQDQELLDFPPVENGSPLKREVITPLQSRWTITTDVASGMNCHVRTIDAGTYWLEDIDWEKERIHVRR